jgi:hypothetical protein
MALLAFFGMSYLYEFGDRDLYEDILRSWGIAPFRFPFVDLYTLLAVWECSRQGIDIYVYNPCDVLPGGFAYSPLWLAGSAIQLSTRDTAIVGWYLDLLFIGSFSLLPPPRRKVELALIVAATMSTMVVFAIERANFDIMLFILALWVGLCAECRTAVRLFGYWLTVVAALLKYYPIMILTVVLRERLAIIIAVALVTAVVVAIFWLEYHVEIAKEHIPSGRYDTDLFAAKNLPLMVGMVAEYWVEPSTFAVTVGKIATGGVYAALAAACIAGCRRLWLFEDFRAALASLPNRERNLLVIGSAVIAGCFFVGQSVGYRGVFLLLVLPGLLAMSRSPHRPTRNLSLGAGVVIVLLMWGDCFRLAIDRRLEHAGGFEQLVGDAKILFWLIRELGWWWTVSLMLVVLADFVRGSSIVHGVSSLFGCLALPDAVTRPKANHAK